MSTTDYHRLGDYIREVNCRNTDLKVKKLLGVSMSKEFRQSTSNIVGTDLSVYKVAFPQQFVCDFMSPIRVAKLPIVLSKEKVPIIVSPAYCVFKVKDIELLLPEYLMMWFRRSEFDRYVTFKCDSAIRGGYGWCELANTMLPIPSIEKQKKIVSQYETLSKRIALNESSAKTLKQQHKLFTARCLLMILIRKIFQRAGVGERSMKWQMLVVEKLVL